MTEAGGMYNTGNSPPTLISIDQKLDILIEQIARLTEGLTEIRLAIQQQAGVNL